MIMMLMSTIVEEEFLEASIMMNLTTCLTIFLKRVLYMFEVESRRKFKSRKTL